MSIKVTEFYEDDLPDGMCDEDEIINHFTSQGFTYKRVLFKSDSGAISYTASMMENAVANGVAEVLLVQDPENSDGIFVFMK